MSELARLYNPIELDDILEERLIYGSYPEIFALAGDVQRREYLHNLAASYLYRDVLEIGGVRHSNKLRNLVRLLAFQIGREVSLTELGSQLQMNKETVATYIDRLEQSFVLFRLGGFSRNLRKEVSKPESDPGRSQRQASGAFLRLAQRSGRVSDGSRSFLLGMSLTVYAPPPPPSHHPPAPRRR